MIVIYHRADFDGLFCREIARQVLGDKATYIGWDYGDKVPPVSEGQLFMLDISIPELIDYPDLIWIDHHKTAIEKYGPRPGIQIDGVAACRLTWQFFNSHMWESWAKADYINRSVVEPLAVRLAGEYDIWDKRDPRADTFQHGLRGTDLEKGWWKSILQVGPGADEVAEELIIRGEAVEHYVKAQNAELIKSIGFDLDFEGRKFLALNTGRYNSLNFEAGLRPEHDGCLGFKWTGTQWSVSMYGVTGKPDEDFTPIALKYGGGGHRQACGFMAASLPFLP